MHSTQSSLPSGSSPRPFRRWAPWSISLLLGALLLGVLPSAFAQSGNSASEASPVGSNGRFSGTVGPESSRWYQFLYTGGGAPVTISLEYQPEDAHSTELVVYTGSPDALQRDQTPVVRQDNTLTTTFTRPETHAVFVRVMNEHANRSVSFVGSIAPTSAMEAQPAGTPTPTPGPVADSAEDALTVGADGQFVGTIGQQRATWYRFWYGNPGANATVSASFSPDADGAALDLYTGSDPDALSRQDGDAAREDDTLSRSVNLPSAQWVYFTIVNNDDETLAYGGEVSPSFAPPVTPTVTPEATATGTPVTPTATATPLPVGPPPAMPHDARYFFETGYRVERDDIWAYFQARGRVDTFGYPVSRTFTLDGCQVQIFQRLVAQVCPGRPGVALINLLDPEIFPYTQVNFSVFPDVNEQLKNQTPQVGSPEYAERILAFVRDHAPDVWEGQPVNFEQTFFGLITPEMAGTDDPGILGLLNLEIWGAPISHPMRDPTNANFIYQRFQRGIMHYDATTGITRGILLADYLKELIRNSAELPLDLREQAAADLVAGRPNARYFAQYCPGAPNWICRPVDLPPATNDLTFAFERG